MKVKATQFTLNILLWLVIGVTVAGAIHITESMYYKYAPIENFIDFQRFDLADYTVGDEFQMVYAYRNSKIETVGDFNFKILCNGYGNNDWNSTSNDVLLNKTKGLEKITIKSEIRNNLPVGECDVYTHIHLEVKGQFREITLTDTFKVLKK